MDRTRWWRRVRGVRAPGGGALGCDSLSHLDLSHEIALQCVMRQREIVGLVVARWRRAREHDERHVLGVRAGARIEERKAADAVGHAGEREAAIARVRIRGVARVQLVRASDPAEAGADEHVAQAE
jgi:hypothetical protein